MVMLCVFFQYSTLFRMNTKLVANTIKHFMQRKQLSDFEKGQIAAWSKEKISAREIGRRLNRSNRCIARFLKRFNATGEIKRRKGSGRKRKTSPRHDRYIERQVLKRRKTTACNVFIFRYF